MSATQSDLSGKQRRFLRALAHDLRPVVQVGHSGWTAGVEKEVDSALEAHELIKIRAAQECPLSPRELANEVEAGTRSHVTQVLGRVLVVYRPRNERPVIVLPAPESA